MAKSSFDTATDINEKSSNFDPIKFALEVYRTVDSHRSTMGSNPSDIIDVPPKQGTSNRPTEPRMNAFFRLIGFPAIRDEKFLNPTEGPNKFASLLSDTRRKARALSADGTLNYFSPGGLQYNSFLGAMSGKNKIFARTPTVEDFNKLISDPLPLDTSIENNPIRRASLFPLIVDASIPIFPLEKRVAPLFFDGDYMLSGGQTRLKRPFLQHVIYMRTKNFSSTNDELKQDLIKNIVNEIGEDNVDIVDFSQFNVLNLEIINKFILALGKAAKEYSILKLKIKEITGKISYKVLPVDNPEERSGSAPLTDDERFVSSLDKELQTINTQLQIEDLFLMSLPIDKINRSDRIRRLEDGIPLNNFTPDAFISEFTSLLTVERDFKNIEKDKILEERSRLIQKMEKARRDVCYYTGEFYGLSIFDIISVFYALFTVDLPALTSILNKDAKLRLLSDPFYTSTVQAVTISTFNKNVLDVAAQNLLSTSSIASGLSLDEEALAQALIDLDFTVAISKIQDKVTEAFLIADSILEKISKTNRPIRNIDALDVEEP